MRDIFTAHLGTETAVKDLSEAVRIAAATPSCLLCFEHAPECCHRLIVAEYMAQATGQSITHLDPELPLLP